MHKSGPMLMPFVGKDVPHAVIEVNQRCNISCKACYKERFDYTKPLSLIEREIELATSMRNLASFTLAGGEPSLHPELPRVIAYIRGKGIMVQMLSNGAGLSDKLLHAYKEAGLKEILLHIDSMQTRPDFPPVTTEEELNPLRDRLADMVTSHGIVCSLELTLYQKTLQELPAMVDYVLRNPRIYRLLVTCCSNAINHVTREFRGGEVLGKVYPASRGSGAGVTLPLDDELERQSVSLREVEEALREKGMEPFGYVGSSLRDEERRWSFYYSLVINSPDGSTDVLHFAPEFRRLVNLTYAAAKKRKRPYPFASIYGELQCLLVGGLYGVGSLSSREMAKTLRFLSRRMVAGASIHHKSFTFQQGPNVTEDGRIEHCKECPDATIRDGVLVPVCFADFFFPIPSSQS